MAKHQKSKAIVFEGAEQVRLIEEEVPEAGAGEVLVETTVSLVSTGTECHCFAGRFDPGTTWANWVKYPFRVGYSAVGRVVQVGADVADLKEGDAVFAGKPHQQFAVVGVDQAVKLPDSVSDEAASWASLAFVVQTGVRRAEHAMGDTAVVIGLGPLGQLAVQYLRLLGLRQVLAIDTVPMRLDVAAAHGATATFCGSAGDARDFVGEHTDGLLADVVYDVTGHWSVLPQALPLARDFGKIMLLGDTPQPSKQHLTHDVLGRQVAVLGTHNIKLQPQYAWWTIRRQIELFFTYVQRGQMHVDDLITHRHPPEEAPALYSRLLADRSDTLGVLFDWQERYAASGCALGG